MSEHFTKKTFQYFELAQKNRKNKKWFEKNHDLYVETVKTPFAHLITKLKKNLSSELPGIQFNPKKISQPLFRANRIPEDGSIIKTHAHFHAAEKALSMFETNPGLYLSVGHNPNETVTGLGLYMVSGRQLSLIRTAIDQDPEEFAEIMANKKFKKPWKGLGGEKYVRFPKGFNPESEGAKYLWHKQYYVGQDLTKSKLIQKSFADDFSKDCVAALPFLKWLRKTVGTYQRRHSNQTY